MAIRLRTRLAARALCAAAGLILIPCALVLPAFADDDFDRRHRLLLAHKDLQFVFDDAAAPKARPPASSWKGFDDFLNTVAPAFTWLLWGVLAVGVAALLWFIGRELLSARFNRRAGVKAEAPPIQETDYHPDAERAHTLLEEADRLAAEGRFDEAVRTLLHRSIDDIEERRPRVVRRALTSREIGALNVLPGHVRDAFAPIVRAVELSWFGGRPLDAAGWSSCRKAYADFAFSQAWR